MADSDSIPITKTCTKCGETKPREAFSRHRYNRCLMCIAAYARLFRKGERTPRPRNDGPTKVCTKCREEKAREAFRKHSYECFACARDRVRVWIEAHPERARAYSRKHYAKNPQRSALATKENRRKYPERERIRQRTYKARNRARVNSNARRYYARSGDALKIRKNISRRAKPELNRAAVKRARARKNHAPINDFTAIQWREMQEAYDHRCTYCEKRCKGHLTQDHITPLSKGGSHTRANIVPACRSCNSKKHVGPPLRPIQPLLL